MSFALGHQRNKRKPGDSKTSAHRNNNIISNNNRRITDLDIDSPDYILHLQRTIGNQAVQGLVHQNNNSAASWI